MSSQPSPPDIIIERAVELWCRALKRPSFDNGDNSENGFLGMGLAGLNADRAIAKVDDYDAAIERFRRILVDRLKYQRDHEGGPIPGERHSNGSQRHYYLSRSLDCDYNPDEDLAAAAIEAGVPLRAFSYKSNVQFYGDFVSASFGYGAPYVNHYPMPGGRWLICRLRGEDIPKIIEAVDAGLLPDMTVEAAA